MKKFELERFIEVLTKVVALVTAIVGVLEVLSEFKKPKEDEAEDEAWASSSFIHKKENYQI